MKKIFCALFLLINVMCNAQSGVALASKQTAQIVDADTANARLLRIANSTKTSTNVAMFTQDTLFNSQKRIWTELDSIRSGNLKRIRVREDSLQAGLSRNERYLKAINEATLTGLSLHSQLTHTNNSVAKASAGVFYGFYVYNSKSSGQFILLFNSTTVPADTTVPYVTSFWVPALSSLSFNTGQYGWPFSTGISWSNSSTDQTKTIGSSDCQMTIIYK